MKKVVTVTAAALLAMAVVGCGKKGSGSAGSSEPVNERTMIHINHDTTPANDKLNAANFNKLGAEYLTASRAAVEKGWVEGIYNGLQKFKGKREFGGTRYTQAAMIAEQETPETIANDVKIDSAFIQKAGSQYEYIRGTYYSKIGKPGMNHNATLIVRGFKGNQFVQVRCSSHTDFDGTTDACGAEIEKQLGIKLEKADIPKLELK